MADVEYQELPLSEQHDSPGGSGKSWTNACCSFVFGLVLILVAVFIILWPTNPRVELVDVDFRGLNLNTTSGVHLDVNLGLTIQVKNPNYVTVEYDQITASFLYHGDELGAANASGGTIPARESVNLTASLKLESLEILKNAAELISDAASERIPVTTSVDMLGEIKFLVVEVPAQVAVLCDLVVNPKNSSLLSRDCTSNDISLRSSVHHVDELKLMMNRKFLGTDISIGSPSFWYLVALLSVLVLLVIIALVWLFWPKAPEITMEEVQLQGFSADTKMAEGSVIPEVVLDVNMVVLLGIRNRNVIGASYDKVTVYVNYYGYELCKGELAGGEIPARDKVSVNVSLNLRGAEIVYNSAQLLTDLSKRELPMNTVIEFSGSVGVWKLKPHIKATVAYDLTVDPVSYDILRQEYHLK